ncbi:glucosaminidase domain-containing protein [Lacticaseibacillus yichunensis]|uniref:Glucosaminidase domain-containing protein n=2 Tax=Bacilli TaxID=91061 RepID=A0ABW4CQC1_9LACO|nr:glucosaminidase domain-containing protein [Lacticaseibacillus yichunensis]
MTINRHKYILTSFVAGTIAVIGLQMGTPGKMVHAADDSSATVRTMMAAARTLPQTINDYITAYNIKPVGVTKEWHTFEMFHYGTSDQLPNGIVFHYTANATNFSARSEADYEINGGWVNAFVHTFIDAKTILNIHDPNYGDWGAGPYANQRFVQFELVTARNRDEFARSIANAAYYTALMHFQYGWFPSLASASAGKSGSIWTHHDVTNYLGGTDHTDPDAYLAQWGYSTSAFLAEVKKLLPTVGEKSVATVTANTKANLTNKAKWPFYAVSGSTISLGTGSAQYFRGNSYTATKILTGADGRYFVGLTNGGATIWADARDLTFNDPIASTTDVSGTIKTAANTPTYAVTQSGYTLKTQKATSDTVAVARRYTLDSGKVLYQTVDGRVVEGTQFTATTAVIPTKTTAEKVAAFYLKWADGDVYQQSGTRLIPVAGSVATAAAKAKGARVVLTKMAVGPDRERYQQFTYNSKVYWVNSRDTITDNPLVDKTSLAQQVTYGAGSSIFNIGASGYANVSATTTGETATATAVATMNSGFTLYQIPNVGWVAADPVATEMTATQQTVNATGIFRVAPTRDIYVAAQGGLARAGNSATIRAAITGDKFKTTKLITTTKGERYFAITYKGREWWVSGHDLVFANPLQTTQTVDVPLQLSAGASLMDVGHSGYMNIGLLTKTQKVTATRIAVLKSGFTLYYVPALGWVGGNPVSSSTISSTAASGVTAIFRTIPEQPVYVQTGKTFVPAEGKALLAAQKLFGKTIKTSALAITQDGQRWFKISASGYTVWLNGIDFIVANRPKQTVTVNTLVRYAAGTSIFSVGPSGYVNLNRTTSGATVTATKRVTLMTGLQFYYVTGIGWVCATPVTPTLSMYDAAPITVPSNLYGVNTTPLTAAQRTFLKTLISYAVPIAQQAQLYPSVMLAQAITESGWGSSTLAKGANNLFGIKADATWKGAVYSTKTQEVINGQTVTVTAKFRRYSTLGDSLRDYAAKIRTNYPGLWRENAATAQIATQGLTRYATAVNYPQTIYSKIVTYRFNLLDSVK